MSTTVGALTTALDDDAFEADWDAASNKSAGSLSDAPSVETKRSDATKLSKSTASNMKCAKRKADRRERHLEYQKKKAASEGREFVQVDQETYREQQRQKMVTLIGGGAVPGSAAENIERVRQYYDKHKMTESDKMKMARKIDEKFRPKFVVSPQSAEVYYACHNRYVLQRDMGGWTGFYCYLCDKWADQAHVSTKGHVDRLLEMSAADEMIGCCTSLRRWSKTPGLLGGLTRQRFRHYWGLSIHNIVPLVRDKVLRGASIKIPYSNKGHLMLTDADGLSFGMCCVSYPGQGKYNDTEDRAVRWEDLQVEDAGEGMDRLIDHKNANQYELMDGIMMRSGSSGQVPRGWWPAVIVTWRDEAISFGMPNKQQYYWLQNAGKIRVWVICWYQLWDGTIVLEAWPIFLAEPRARL